jgi:hypothetical protein
MSAMDVQIDTAVEHTGSHRRACPGDPPQEGTAVPHDRGGRDKPGHDRFM